MWGERGAARLSRDDPLRHNNKQALRRSGIALFVAVGDNYDG